MAPPRLKDHAGTIRVLDRYYISTRYPDALQGSLPFEVYDDAE